MTRFHIGSNKQAYTRRLAIHRNLILLVAAAGMLASCASSRNFYPEQVTAAEVRTDLAAPTIEDRIGSPAPYLIAPRDQLAVTVFGVPDLRTVAAVDSAGNFTMPLIGAVPAAGQTPETLAAAIRDRLAARYIRNPQVTVNVEEAAGQQLTVDGSVTRPGQYQLTGPTTLNRAIAIAGGLTEFGNAREVVVFRTVGGIRQVARFDLAAIRGGRAADPEIFANDLIIVGQDNNARLWRDILTAAPLVGVFYQFAR